MSDEAIVTSDDIIAGLRIALAQADRPVAGLRESVKRLYRDLEEQRALNVLLAKQFIALSERVDELS